MIAAAAYQSKKDISTKHILSYRSVDLKSLKTKAAMFILEASYILDSAKAMISLYRGGRSGTRDPKILSQHIPWYL